MALDVDQLWEALRPSLKERRLRYSWPAGCTFEESLCLRAHLEVCIQRDLEQHGFVSFATFQKVMYWGFGRVPKQVTPAALEHASAEAFAALRDGRLADAVSALIRLPGVGVSRATKILALSDQSRRAR